MLGVKKLHPDAKVPTKNLATDAGFDIFSLEEVHIPKGVRKVIRTGIALEIPEGMWVSVTDRSSMARRGLDIKAGVLDAGYTGEVSVIIKNDECTENYGGYIIEKGHKIAQLIYHRVETIGLIEVTNLPETRRGDRAFGSSGK